MELKRVSEIEDLIAQNKLDAARVFTQMKQLVYREAPCHALCEKQAYELKIRTLKNKLEKEIKTVELIKWALCAYLNEEQNG